MPRGRSRPPGRANSDRASRRSAPRSTAWPRPSPSSAPKAPCRGSRRRSLQVGERAGAGADVLGARPDQAALALLLEDVGRPAGGARAGEQRREQLRRDLGAVEHDRRPELDVGRQHAVGLARLQLGQRGLLERLGDLEARRAELARGAAQHAGARVLGAVDAVAEAHQPLAAVERRLDLALGVARRARPRRASSARARARRRAAGRTARRPRADSAAATSAPVEATTRAVNVEAFMPCSAAEIQ